MDRLNSIFKKLRLDRIIIVFLAGFLLLIGTGCSDAAQAKVPSHESVGKAGSYNDRINGQTELYDPIQDPKGGMNNYSDVDPRVNTSSTGAKAKGLVDNAARNIQRVENPRDPKQVAGEIRKGTPIQERVQNIVDEVGGSAKNTAEDFSKGTKRGVENLKDNANTAKREFSEEARHSANDTANSAQDRAGKAVRGTQRGVTDAAEALNSNRAK